MKIDTDGKTLRRLKACGALSGRSLLEIGCGDGRVTGALAGRVDRLVAVDTNAEDLLRASRRIGQAEFIQATGEQLPLPNDRFDTVLFSLSLHHQNSRLALSEAGRVVRTGGRVLILEPALDGEIQQLFHLFEDETDALTKAMVAVEGSLMRVDLAIQFDIDWLFVDKYEFSRHIFDYYRRTRDAGLEAVLFRQLGDKGEDRPLVLKDRLKLLRLVR